MVYYLEVTMLGSMGCRVGNIHPLLPCGPQHVFDVRDVPARAEIEVKAGNQVVGVCGWFYQGPAMPSIFHLRCR
jgi:hypothetical protein